MTNPSRFFYCARNLADEAVITGTVAAVSSLPLTNLQNSDRDFVWRSTNDNAQDLIFNLSNTTSQRINFVCLWRHNLETSATWRVRLYTSYDASGAAAYDSGDVAALDSATLGELDFGVDPLGGPAFNGMPRFSVVYFMENTATVINSVRITITDTGNSAGYVEASRVYFGRGTELTYNWENLHVNWQENTKQGRTDGASIYSDGSEGFRELQADLKWVHENDRAGLMDAMRYSGMRRDWFMSGKPGVGGEEERDQTMIARITKMPNLSTLFYSVYSSQLKAGEI